LLKTGIKRINFNFFFVIVQIVRSEPESRCVSIRSDGSSTHLDKTDAVEVSVSVIRNNKAGKPDSPE